ncbi:hypothetical protein CFIO01_02881 [Colletotrichum fioriniae PJ7]|uniref:Uncharacterized protein n=1 Tax=Colletotrichum fioriniae PJ7 TaxID=1445577 RepID=A0A010R7A3_9PEZI|nr:hypothetical protein CFIO01_02881 [Colletotrichum fioriniae PJ7]
MPRQGVTGGNPQQQQRRPPHTTHTPVAHTPTPTLHAHSRLTDINIAPTFPFPVHSRPVPAIPSYASLFRRHLDTDDDNNDDYDFDKQRPRPPIIDQQRHQPRPIDDTGKSSTPSINIDNHPRDIPDPSILPFRHPPFLNRAARLSHALIRHPQPPKTTLRSRECPHLAPFAPTTKPNHPQVFTR